MNENLRAQPGKVMAKDVNDSLASIFVRLEKNHNNIKRELAKIKKSCIRFDLPEQQEDMNIALNGHKYLRALCDIKDMLYSIKKWGLDSTWEDKSANDLFNHIDERFHETVEGLNL